MAAEVAPTLPETASESESELEVELQDVREAEPGQVSFGFAFVCIVCFGHHKPLHYRAYVSFFE